MKTLFFAAAGLVLAAGFADAALAADAAHARQHAKRYHRPPAAVRAPRGGGGAWRAHDSGALPFGSGGWWEQMLREGRLNGDTM